MVLLSYINNKIIIMWEIIQASEKALNKEGVDSLIENFNKTTNKNWFDYKIIWYTDWKTNKEVTAYKAVFMWETLDIELNTPEELIDMLKLINKIISIYKNEWYNSIKWEKFYTKLWRAGTDKKDLAIDNRPTEFLDTTFLSQEWLAELLNEKQNNLLNTYMEELADFLNKVVRKI